MTYFFYLLKKIKKIGIIDLHCHMQCYGITLAADGAVCVQLMGLS